MFLPISLSVADSSPAAAGQEGSWWRQLIRSAPSHPRASPATQSSSLLGINLAELNEGPKQFNTQACIVKQERGGRGGGQVRVSSGKGCLHSWRVGGFEGWGWGWGLTGRETPPRIDSVLSLQRWNFQTCYSRFTANRPAKSEEVTRWRKKHFLVPKPFRWRLRETKRQDVRTHRRPALLHRPFITVKKGTTV